jgi:hypothetical protein
MMKKAVFVLLSLVLVVGLGQILLAEEVNVSGVWKMTAQTPRGERVSEITLLQEGEKLTVTSKDRDGNDVKSEGTVKGHDVTWTMKRETPMGEFVITYTGKVEAQTMKGTMSFGPQAEGRTGEWKAEKVPAPAAPAAPPASPAAPATPES